MSLDMEKKYYTTFVGADFATADPNNFSKFISVPFSCNKVQAKITYTEAGVDFAEQFILVSDISNEPLGIVISEGADPGGNKPAVPRYFKGNWVSTNTPSISRTVNFSLRTITNGTIAGGVLAGIFLVLLEFSN